MIYRRAIQLATHTCFTFHDISSDKFFDYDYQAKVLLYKFMQWDQYWNHIFKQIGFYSTFFTKQGLYKNINRAAYLGSCTANGNKRLTMWLWFSKLISAFIISVTQSKYSIIFLFSLCFLFIIKIRGQPQYSVITFPSVYVIWRTIVGNNHTILCVAFYAIRIFSAHIHGWQL
jgi:hypothetical protein